MKGREWKGEEKEAGGKSKDRREERHKQGGTQNKDKGDTEGRKRKRVREVGCRKNSIES